MKPELARSHVRLGSYTYDGWVAAPLVAKCIKARCENEQRSFGYDPCTYMTFLEYWQDRKDYVGLPKSIKGSPLKASYI